MIEAVQTQTTNNYQQPLQPQAPAFSPYYQYQPSSYDQQHSYPPMPTQAPNVTNQSNAAGSLVFHEGRWQQANEVRMFEDNKAINNPFPYATFASDQHVHSIKLRLLVTETSRNRKKKENRGKIDSHQARLLQRKESRWNIYYDVSIKNPHPNSLISINRVFSHK